LLHKSQYSQCQMRQSGTISEYCHTPTALRRVPDEAG
jgi:hypothetical protein